MPITFKIAPHDAAPVNHRGKLQDPSPEEVLKQAWKSQTASCKELLRTSLSSSKDIIPDSSGFVQSVITAYNAHHNLIIKPDDLWTSILSQFNLYVNAHGEELRNSFVDFEGQRTLKIIVDGTRYTVDYGAIAAQFGVLLKENIVDPSLHDWILPKFTTTTHHDTVTCSVMMMATLKAYFTYEIHLRCGIPSITLLGEKLDYEAIAQKLNKLEEFGVEPAAFARLLRPVVNQFVLAFDAMEKNEAPNLNFWGRICHYHMGGSGPSYIGGWISTFCVWNKDGKWQGPDLSTMEIPLTRADIKKIMMQRGSPPVPYVFEGLRYPTIDTNKIPPGICDVDIMLFDANEIVPCTMVAGHVGYVALPSGDDGDLNTLQPSSEWFMFVSGEGTPYGWQQ